LKDACRECRNGAMPRFSHLCTVREDTVLSTNDCGGLTVSLGPYAGNTAYYDGDDRLIGFTAFTDATDDENGCFTFVYGAQCKALQAVKTCTAPTRAADGGAARSVGQPRRTETDGGVGLARKH
jgi:hypothetical protein